MSCGHCVAAVRKALESVDGLTVNSVEIGKAVATAEDPVVITPHIIDAVDEAGYAADVVTH
jgi:copper chaperone